MPIEPVGPVVVGSDGTAESTAAVELAAEEAMGRVVPLVVVHARDGRPTEESGRLDGARRLLTEAVSTAWAEHPSLSVAAELVSGDPADALVARSRGASLLVVGHRAHGESGGSPAGSTAHQVVARAEVPVLVHRPLATAVPAPPQPRPVLVGVAGEPGDDAVVEFAFAEASLRGAPLWALHIWPRPASAEDAAIGYGFAEARDTADRMLVDALQAWSQKYPDVAVHRVLRHGLDIPVALTAASRSAQLVVVGSRRDGPHPSPLTVPQYLLRRAGCSVAVVPAG